MSVNNYITSRTIGDATITIIYDGSDLWPPGFPVPEGEWRAAMPEANAAGEIRMGSNVGLVEIADIKIVIDPGLDDPGSSWQRENEDHFVGMVRTAGMQAGLDSIGIDNNDVTHVIITHAHYDHFIGVLREQDGGLVPRFPNARHLLHQADWESNPDLTDVDSDASIRLGTIDRSGLIDLVDSDQEIVPGVTMIHAPGESPGHCIVRVRSGGDTFFYAGDLFHHPCEVTHLNWVPASEGGRDAGLMLASRRSMIAEAVPANAVIVNNHGLFPPWGRIVQTDDGYAWQYLSEVS